MIGINKYKEKYYKTLLYVLSQSEFENKKILIISGENLLKKVNKNLKNTFKLNSHQLWHILKFQRNYKIYKRSEPSEKYLFIKKDDGRKAKI